GGCEGMADSVLITISPLPTKPNAGADVTYCQGDTILPIVASGGAGTLTWYTNQGLTNVASVGASFTPNISALGSVNYYVTETNAFGCESPADVVNVTINPLPSAPVVTGVANYCENE